jgi:hypothetical protein
MSRRSAWNSGERFSAAGGALPKRSILVLLTASREDRSEQGPVKEQPNTICDVNIRFSDGYKGMGSSPIIRGG